MDILYKTHIDVILNIGQFCSQNVKITKTWKQFSNFRQSLAWQQCCNKYQYFVFIYGGGL